MMRYYMATTIHKPFERCIEEVKTTLQAEEFGVLTDIDVN